MLRGAGFSGGGRWRLGFREWGLGRGGWHQVLGNALVYDEGMTGHNGKSAKLRLVLAWIEIHQDELMANWELAVAGEQIFKIDPLR